MNLDVVFDYDTGFPGYNLFAYCGNSPVFRIDVSGNDSDGLEDNKSKLTQADNLDGGGDGVPPAPVGGSTSGIQGIIGQPTRNKDTVDYTKIKPAGNVGLDDPIYRYGGTEKSKYVPGENDVEGSKSPGLSFGAKYRSGSGYTTIREINNSGMFYAVNDEKYHIAVFPTTGSLLDWHLEGEDSPLTEALFNMIQLP